MDKNDKIFLLISLPLCALGCFLLHKYFATDINASFWISTISAALTVAGFLFTIHLQLKIETTSRTIKQNSDSIYQNIHQELNNYHLGKAIALANNIESEIRNSDLKSALSMINQLQEELAECSKIFSVNLIKHLQDCFNCGDFVKKSMKDILAECKTRSQNEKNEVMQDMSVKLANHYVNLNVHILQNGHNFASESLVRDMENLKILLNSAKTPVTNLFIQ